MSAELSASHTRQDAQATDRRWLADYVNPRVVARSEELAQAFAEASPFRHVVIDGFFEPAFCQRLIEEFPPFETGGAVNENGELGDKATREDVDRIGPAYAELDRVVQSRALRGFIGEIADIPDLLYDPHYFGGGTHENREGQELDPHIDFNYHPLTGWHRRLNLIVYLNEEWDPAWGGSIELHRNPRLAPEDDEIVSIAPVMNRAVLFETTEHSWHGFRRIVLPEDKRQLSRRSFALYYYSEQRPAEELAPSHSTIYVERPLPERFQAGLTLTEADVAELRRILARRDQHIERLYNYLLAMAPRPQTDTAKGAERRDEGRWSQCNREALIAELMRYRAQLDAMYRSTSWRATKPLRGVKLALDKLRGR